ncbi:hypothetical protein ACFVH9_07470 [Streptomyces hirsutus]|uniref:hypothetical protein n=1 Tax=Streptomyces hirsutus TaxID=35620 RepID=UPI00362C089E
MSSFRPSVGRTVHYRSLGTPVREDGTQEFPPQCRAAIITEVEADSDLVGLAVLNPTGTFFHSLAAGGCAHDEALAFGGTWHWPERV